MSGASVKYPSHSAPLVVATSIVPPPHRGTKHLLLIRLFQLLRNCPLDELAGRAIDQVEAEMCGALP